MESKKIIITGSATRIGASIAKSLAGHGTQITLHYNKSMKAVKNLKKEFDILKKELIKYNPELLDKQYMVVLSKADLLDDELRSEYSKELKTHFNEVPHLIISSAIQFQLTELKDELWKLLNT